MGYTCTDIVPSLSISVRDLNPVVIPYGIGDRLLQGNESLAIEMSRQILTDPIESDQLITEFDFFLTFYIEQGVLECKVLFGIAWGVKY